MSAVARDVQRHAVQLLPVAVDDALPSPLVSRGTGVRQRQFLQTQGGAEGAFLFGGNVGGICGRILRRILKKILAQNFVEDRRELLRVHVVSRSPAALVKSRSNVNVCSLGGLGGLWHFLAGHVQDDASNFLDARKKKSYVLRSASRERHSWNTRG